MADVIAQTEFGPRVPGSEAHRRCADWLAAQLRESVKHAEDVRRQIFFHIPPAPLREDSTVDLDTVALCNIIAAFKPRTPDRLMLCAHWDSRRWADQDPDTSKHREPVLGANDGASGVAVLLELARMMSAVPPPIGIDIVLFDAEDQGAPDRPDEFLVGSRWFASQARNYRPMAVILLDMIGDRDLSIPREVYSDSLAPVLTDLVWETAARLGLVEFVDSVGVAVVDDHLPFLFNGIPAVDIIDFEYEYWHTVDDTPDKVSAQSLATVGRLVTELIYHTPVERLRTSVRPLAQ
jgi:Zn-dependent M28 family amino/carboxypeptidase